MVAELTSIVSVNKGIVCFLKIANDTGAFLLTKGGSEQIRQIMKTAKDYKRVEPCIISMINDGELEIYDGEIDGGIEVYTWRK